MKAIQSMFACALLWMGGPAISQDQPVECGTSGEVLVFDQHVLGTRQLSRQYGNFHAQTTILSTKGNSLLWQTKCPVPLNRYIVKKDEPEILENPPSTVMEDNTEQDNGDRTCRRKAMFQSGSRLTIRHSGGINYEFKVDNLLDGGELTGRAEARGANDTSTGSTLWLASTSSNYNGYDFYIFLEDQRLKLPGANCTPGTTPPSDNCFPRIKAYRIEAYAPGQCGDHRPGNSLCPVTGCTTLGVNWGHNKQTDTGGGNEPPGIP